MKIPLGLLFFMALSFDLSAFEPDVLSSLDPTLKQAILPAPDRVLRAVIDSDTYNEVDDQFAIVYALLSADRLKLEAIYAAPFLNKRSTSAADGMEKSFEEILRLLEKMKVPADDFVFRGSEHFLKGPDLPEPSEAADDLIERAMSGSPDDPLYVITIGAITNVASALMKEPRIADKIVVVWLGGDAPRWSNRPEFNLRQDALAASIVLDSGVPFVQIPCLPVASHLTTTVPELATYVKGQGAIGDYLYEIVESYGNGRFAWSKVIWDISAVAYLVNPGYSRLEIVHSPIMSPDRIVWGEDRSRHLVGMVKWQNRDAIFGDFFRKLQRFAESK